MCNVWAQMAGESRPRCQDSFCPALPNEVLMVTRFRSDWPPELKLNNPSYHFPTNFCLKRTRICVFCESTFSRGLHRHQGIRHL